MLRLRLLTALLAPVILLAAACGGGTDVPTEPSGTSPGGGTGGPDRGFLMGVSSQPAKMTEEAYRDAFEVAEAAGEIVLIQRTPPWTEFIPGGSISSRTEQLTLLERELASEHRLKLFLAIDPTVPGDRGQLANLPDGLAGEGFANKDVRAAFVAYAKYLALNYKPAYMALGVEVDMIYRAQDADSFSQFISLYFEAYDAVKSVSADTQVFPTFQYEDMLGLLDTGSATLPSWNLINRFEPKIDLLAVTSYPSLVFESVSEVPEDYYDALQDHLDRPLAFASVGWNSREAGSESSDSDQIAYLYKVLGAVGEQNARMLVWYLGRDPESAPSGFEPLMRMGLHDAAGTPKAVWRVWQEILARPIPAP